MKKQKAFVFDIDDTLVFFIAFLCMLYYKIKFILLSESDLSWELEYKDGLNQDGSQIYNNDVYKLYKEYENEGLYSSLPLIPGARETLDSIRRLGYKVIILTARPPKYKKETYLYFLMNNLYYDKIIHNSDKVEALNKLAEKYDIIGFADDKLSTIHSVAIECEIDNIFLVNRPHNRTESIHPKIRRVNNVLECVRIIEGKHD